MDICRQQGMLVAMVITFAWRLAKSVLVNVSHAVVRPACRSVLAQSMSCDSAALLQLSVMQRLQHLHVSAPLKDKDGIRPADLAHLPVSLTALQLLRFAPGSKLNPSTAPRMQQLRQLKVLQLSEVSVNACLLCHMAGLQELRLAEVLPAQANKLSRPAQHFARKKGGKAADNQPAQGALLEVIGRMQQLRNLKLESCQLHEGNSNLKCFAALTAAKQLTSLNIYQSRHQPLPVGALAYMLPAGKQMLQLEVLALRSGLLQPAAAANVSSAVDAGGGVSPGSSSVGMLDACDVFRTVDACPALRLLSLSHVLRGGEGLPGVIQAYGPNCCSLHLEVKVRPGAVVCRSAD
jgi:hypothetical protein